MNWFHLWAKTLADLGWKNQKGTANSHVGYSCVSGCQLSYTMQAKVCEGVVAREGTFG